MRDLHSLFHKVLAQAASNRAFERKARSVLINLLETDGNASEELLQGALTRFDITSFVDRHGLLALRDYLERFSADDLRTYVREEKLSASGVSKLAKAQVINRIVMAVRRAA